MATGRAFFGRAEDLEALDRLVKAGERLLTLTGPGGVGKTRLARQWLERRDGVFCDLSDARTLGDVCAIVARSLAIGGPQPKESMQVDRIGRALATRGSTLLVLDNCEQVTAPATRAIERWHALANETLFLVTSREPLRMTAERVHPVPPLSLPEPGKDPALADAVRMFADRVTRVRPGWELGKDAPVVAEIVRRLDGLPLAIELAAARAAVLGVPAILERLARRLDLLSSGPRDLAERQRTMRNAIQWSWDLLDDRERSALAQCSIFRGGFSIDAAEAILEIDGDVLDVVQGLVEKSMLRSYEVRGEVRLGMYDAIREFCAEKLDAESSVLERHAAHYVRAGARWAAEVATSADRLQTIAIELENLRAAHTHALANGTEDGARDAGDVMLAMVPAIAAHGSIDELLRLLDATIARCEGVSVAPIASLLTARAEARATAGDLDAAESDLARALEAARKGDRATEGRALAVAGLIAWHRGDFDRAEKTFEEAVAIAHRVGDADSEAIALRRLANIALDRHRREDARKWVERARELVMRTGNRREEATVLGTLGLIHHLGRQYTEAESMGLRALKLFRDLGEDYRAAITLGNLGIIEQQLGRAEEARTFFEGAVTGARLAGDRRLLGTAMVWLARLDHEEGRLEAAYERYVEGLDYLAEVNARRAVFLAARAALESDRGNVAGASSLLADAHAQIPPDDAHAKSTVEIYRAYVERSPIDPPKQLAEESEDVAFALRLMKRRPAAPIPKHADTLHIGPDGEWFRTPSGTRVDLSKRRSLRQVLVALATHRREAPGQPLTVEGLVKLGWPGERMQSKSGAMRAYTSITRLRKLGLSEALLSRGAGYLLDPRIEIVFE